MALLEGTLQDCTGSVGIYRDWGLWVPLCLRSQNIFDFSTTLILGKLFLTCYWNLPDCDFPHRSMFFFSFESNWNKFKSSLIGQLFKCLKSAIMYPLSLLMSRFKIPLFCLLIPNPSVFPIISCDLQGTFYCWEFMVLRGWKLYHRDGGSTQSYHILRESFIWVVSWNSKCSLFSPSWQRVSSWSWLSSPCPLGTALKAWCWFHWRRDLNV